MIRSALSLTLLGKYHTGSGGPVFPDPGANTAFNAVGIWCDVVPLSTGQENGRIVGLGWYEKCWNRIYAWGTMIHGEEGGW